MGRQGWRLQCSTPGCGDDARTVRFGFALCDLCLGLTDESGFDGDPRLARLYLDHLMVCRDLADDKRLPPILRPITCPSGRGTPSMLYWRARMAGGEDAVDLQESELRAGVGVEAIP